MQSDFDKLAFCVDLGGTAIKGAVINNLGKFLYQTELKTAKNQGVHGVIGQITGMVHEMQSAGNCADHQVAGVGIGIPGWVDQSSGIVKLAPNLGWRDAEILAVLQKEIALPIYLENDANLAAWGEHWQGAGKEVDDMLLITIGTGIGSGLILNGKLHRGFSGMGAEIGHMQLVPHGVQCGCGNYGCLETLTSATAIVRRAWEERSKKQATCLNAVSNLEAKDVFTCASQEDPVALQLLKEVADFLATAILNITLLIDLPLVVLGGGVAAAGSILLDPVNKSLTEKMTNLPHRKPQVIQALLGNKAGVMGAAKMVFAQENWFDKGFRVR